MVAGKNRERRLAACDLGLLLIPSTIQGTTAQYGGNGATPQIFDLKRGCFAPWAKPRILWILTLSGVVFSAIHLLQVFRFTAMTGGSVNLHFYRKTPKKCLFQG